MVNPTERCYSALQTALTSKHILNLHVYFNVSATDSSFLNVDYNKVVW